MLPMLTIVGAYADELPPVTAQDESGPILRRQTGHFSCFRFLTDLCCTAVVGRSVKQFELGLAQAFDR